MKTVLFQPLSGLILLVTTALSAEPAAKLEPPGDLMAATSRQTSVRASIIAEFGERLAAVKGWYAAQLDALQKEMTTRGDLDGVIANKSERERMDRPLSPEEQKALPGELANLRGRYEQAVAQLAGMQKGREIAQAREYIATLEGLQKRLTQQADVEAALKVKTERVAASEQLASLEGSKAAPPPLGTSLPNSPIPSVVPPPVSPAVLTQRPAGPATGVTVAAEIKAKGDVTSAGANVVVFDGPAGDGRRGAKGVLLKNDPLTGQKGSTWSFRYVRDGSATNLEIIHPHGRGQAIFHLTKIGVGTSTPAAWSEVGYNGGDTKRVKPTSKFGEIFPLKDAEEYEVVSKLSPTGGWELSMNGKVVATARVTGVSPLSLEIPPDKKYPGGGRGPGQFKGGELPLRWAAGYAALLLGPLDSGTNTCREVRFQPSAPEPGRLGGY